MKKFLCILMAALMMVTMFAACGKENATKPSNNGSTPSDASQAGGTFKIGGIGPITGGAATYGISVKQGMELAVKEINALDSNIKFEAKFADDEHDAEKSVNAYNNLKDWGMQMLIGTVTSTPCIAVASETYSDRMIEITPSGSSPDIIADKDNVFQICFTDPNQGLASADYIAEHSLATKVAVIYKSDDAYSTGIYNKFKEEAANVGIEIVYAGTFTSDTENDFSVQIGEAQAKGAELLFLPIYYTPASLILNQANQVGYDPIVFGVDGMDGILTIDGFDTSLAEGVYLLTPFAADATDEKTVAFVKAYNEAYGETPTQFAADGYDAVYTYYEAIKAAGCSADMSAEEICEAIIAVMPEISVTGLTGTMTWIATGEVSKDPMAVIIKDGAYTAA